MFDIQKDRIAQNRAKAGSRILRRSLSILLCFSLCLPWATASIPIIQGAETGDHELVEISTLLDNGTGVTILGMQTANGSAYCAVYCIEKGRETGSSYNTSLDKSGAGWSSPYSDQMFWIVQNGYKGNLSGGSLSGGINSYGLTPEEAYIATQWAIWHFSDGFMPPGGADANILLMYNALVTGASGAEAYNPLSGGDPEIEIFFEYNGGYDPVTGYFGPLKLEVAYMNMPYSDKIWNTHIPVKVIGGAGAILRSYPSNGVLGNQTTMYSGDEFYVELGFGLSSGSMEIVHAEASVDCSVTDEGFYFWSPSSVGVQAICGWGDYRVKTESIINGEGGFSVVSFIVGGKKTVSGNPAVPRDFIFTLAESNSSYTSNGLAITATVSGGEFTFPTVVMPYTYDTPDVYYYKVYEADYSDDEWTYDTQVREVKVAVNGGSPVVTYTKGDREFKNIWDGDSGAPSGELIVKKELGANHADWGVTSKTEFQATIKDVTNGAYVLLTGTGPVYEFNGTAASGSLITFSAGQEATVVNLPADVTYRVEEAGGAHYTAGGTPTVLVSDGETAQVTIVNNYEHGTGVLIVNKRLEGSYSDWGVTPNVNFYVKIKDATMGNTLIFKPAPEPDGSYLCVGNETDGLSDPASYSGFTVSELPVSEGKPLRVSNLWAGRAYVVEETSGAGVQHYAVSYEGNNVTLTQGANKTVTVVNHYDLGTGGLIVNKSLAGSYTAWDVDAGTVFKAVIKDVSRNNHLLFKDTPEPNGSYRCVGNDVDGLSEPYDGNVIMELPFSVSRPLTLLNLWADTAYEVIEEGGAHYTTQYIGNNVSFPDGENRTVTVVNTYEHGMGNLVVSKTLGGDYTAWGVNPSTVFSLRVKDRVTGEYLRFLGYGPDYEYRSHSGSGDSSSGDILTVSSGQNILIKGLPSGGVYEIEELFEDHCAVSYTGNGVSVSDDGNSFVTVNNEYISGTGALIVNKKLAGGYADWGVDSNVTFKARIKTASGEFLRLKGSGPVYVYDGIGAAGDPITVSAGQPVRITGLPDGEYTVIEDAGSYSSDCRYEGGAAAAVIAGGQNSTATITNTYEHKTGSLIISKRLAGSYADWDADHKTAYQVRIKDVTNNNYLLFTGDGAEYYCYGNSGSDDSSTGGVITVSAGQPVTVTNLWINCRYLVEEVGGANYTASYEGNNEVFQQGKNMTVTVVNTYQSKPGGDPKPPVRPDPYTPGGTDPDAPPVPTNPENTLVPDIDEEGNLFYIEFDDEGVPLGEWYWDDDLGMWIFDEDIPLGDWDMPKTGGTPLHYYLMPLGLLMISMGLFLSFYGYRPKAHGRISWKPFR